MFYCLIVGSRSFNDYDKLKEICDFALSKYKNITIVSGGANGTDSLAEKYAKDKGYKLIIFKADWDTYGKSAGYKRNDEMHKFISQHKHRGCIVFWDGKSKGTKHSFDLANKYNNQLIKIMV